MTRIVAGRLGGRRLAVPPGTGTRPTADRVREALFSTLTTLTDLDGCRFADLYAGSGAVGLEAASRGAASVLLVESEARAVRVVRDNVATLGLTGVCQVRAAKVLVVVSAGPGAPYDVIFADPPYATDDAEVGEVLTGLAGLGWLARDGLIVVERSARSPEPTWPDNVTTIRSRRYGEAMLWYGRRDEPAGDGAESARPGGRWSRGGGQ